MKKVKESIKMFSNLEIILGKNSNFGFKSETERLRANTIFKWREAASIIVILCIKDSRGHQLMQCVYINVHIQNVFKPLKSNKRFPLAQHR